MPEAKDRKKDANPKDNNDFKQKIRIKIKAFDHKIIATRNFV